jgi:hypothetical protein
MKNEEEAYNQNDNQNFFDEGDPSWVHIYRGRNYETID